LTLALTFAELAELEDLLLDLQLLRLGDRVLEVLADNAHDQADSQIDLGALDQGPAAMAGRDEVGEVLDRALVLPPARDVPLDPKPDLLL